MLRGVDPKDRAGLWIVFVVATTVIAVEAVSFQTIVYVNEYLQATQVIAVALMGIALGGLLAFFLERFDANRVDAAILSLFPVSVVASFFVIAWLNTHRLVMMTCLTLPYVLASLVVSRAFNRMRPSLVYLFDLVGAGLGAWVVVFSLPWLREEGSFMLLGILACAPLLLEARRRDEEKARRSLVRLARVFAAVLAVALVLQVVLDPLNLARIAVVDHEQYPYKFFHRTNPAEGEEQHRFIIDYSRGSLVERIDVGHFASHEKQTPRGFRFYTGFNAALNDNIGRGKSEAKGILDRRLPTRLRLGKNPDALLIGMAAEGMTKPVYSLGNGHRDGVEINPAIVDLMTGPLRMVSGRAYDGYDVHVCDGRTFLARSSRKYDFITLLNTHRIRSVGDQGPPEYLHTVEAMRSLLRNLKRGGFLVLEEREVNERAELGIRRIMRTAMTALADLGARRPADHFFVYALYANCARRWVFGDERRCDPNGLYTMILVKRTPITDEEVAHFHEWNGMLSARTKGQGKYRGLIFRYLPQEPGNNRWTDTLLADDVFDIDGMDRTIHDMSTITDDRPFPYDVYLERKEPWETVRTTAFLALVLVLLPALVAFVARGREARAGLAVGARRLLNATTLVSYFGVLGLGYLLIEVVLMQKFQVFVSSPVYSLVVVLTTLLVASGVGGYFSGRLSKGKVLLSLLGVVALTALYAWALGPVLGALIALPFLVRILVAVVLIAPLGFLMGLPFPFAMAVTKSTLGDRHAGLFFGINGALAAVATPLAILASMIEGFHFTFLLGGAAYLACVVLLAPVWTGGPRAESPSPSAAE